MLRRLTAVALVTAGFLSVPTAAHAVDVTSPPNQSVVTEGTTVTVSGGDCPSDEVVRVFFTAAAQKAVTTTAGADGSWSVDLRVPRLALGDVVEASEQNIAAECAGQRDSALVAYNAASPREEELPYTGAAPTGAIATLGAALVVLGVGAAYAGRRRIA